MIRICLLLLLGAFGGAALFTPLIYSGLLLLFPDLPWPFSRVFSRVAMLSVIVLLYVLRKDLHLSELKEFYKPLGSSRWSNTKRLGFGVLLSLLASALFFPLILQYGVIVLNERTPLELTLKLLRTLPAALLIGFIEESFFRVILFHWFQKRFSIVLAALFSSGLYAMLHFIAPVKNFQYESFSPFAGFEYVSQIFQRMFLLEVVPAVFGLLLVGITLCLAVHLTRSIYLSVGLHAGWVLAVKGSSAATDLAAGIEYAAGVGRRYYLVSTPRGWASIVLVCVVVWVLYSKKQEVVEAR